VSRAISYRGNAGGKAAGALRYGCADTARMAMPTPINPASLRYSEAARPAPAGASHDQARSSG
jgi:hypothetical protein